MRRTLVNLAIQNDKGRAEPIWPCPAMSMAVAGSTDPSRTGIAHQCARPTHDPVTVERPTAEARRTTDHIHLPSSSP